MQERSRAFMLEKKVLNEFDPGNFEFNQDR